MFGSVTRIVTQQMVQDARMHAEQSKKAALEKKEGSGKAVEMKAVSPRKSVGERKVESPVSSSDKLERVRKAMDALGYQSSAREEHYLLRMVKGKAVEVGRMKDITEEDVAAIEMGNFVFSPHYSEELSRRRRVSVAGFLVGTRSNFIMEEVIKDKALENMKTMMLNNK